MARPRPSATEAIGSDSFTDVVTNIVGILIILVMIAGIRVRHAPVSAASTTPPPSDSPELARLTDQAGALESDIHLQERLLGGVNQEIGQRRLERGALALAVAAAQRELDLRQRSLDQETQAALELQATLGAARRRLTERNQALAETRQVPPPPTIELRTQGTPLSRTVLGDELHFQVNGGRVTWVPLQELMRLLEGVDRDGLRDRLQSRAEVSDVVGPLDGYRLKFTLVREDIPAGWKAHLREFILIPSGSDLGHTVEEALQSGSAFRGKLGDANPRSATVTLWTYPDGFGDFQRLKAELYRLGYRVACRPLPEGQSIGGSPDGTRSAAQ